MSTPFPAIALPLPPDLSTSPLRGQGGRAPLRGGLRGSRAPHSFFSFLLFL
ncbi:hypothetical protein MBAV_001631 [Candidatus Magnetobacterium bavaricum]|uniref:Uncharacterized protein n=1 Tax=Candidatus Magnetobacterium bavaricum TaxID=29290 RepID=A0A0F3GWA8_9BACT|nr:hypothetical protein MBAV_001631 [Candidatus Magnetobacterium bavaricum]